MYEELTEKNLEHFIRVIVKSHIEGTANAYVKEHSPSPKPLNQNGVNNEN